MTTDLRLGNTQEVQRDEALVSSEHRELGLLAPRQQAVLSIRARVDECDAATFVHDSLETIHTYLVEHHIHPDGPPFVLCKSAGVRAIDVEAGWPLDRSVDGAGRIHAGSLPPTLIGHDPHRTVARRACSRQITSLG
jgi:hypothetical protein